MRLGNSVGGWGVVHVAIHWLTAALIAWTAWLGLTMTDLPRFDPATFATYNLHKSLGVTVLVIAVVRLAWRLMQPSPALPDGMSVLERRTAAGSHIALYALLFVVPILGWLNTAAADIPVNYFGRLTLPQPIAADERLQWLFETAHEFAAKGLLFLIALHVLGALKHHFVDKDDVLRRMIVPTQE